MNQTEPVKHTLIEDVLAILLGTMMVGLGLTLYAKATLVTGSTAGIALIIQYLTSIPFGIGFLVINLPFYVLAVLRMGWAFAIKTVCCVALVSLFSWATPQWLEIGGINPIYAALAGGGLTGLGLLALFRHRASVGGVNILALYLQENFGIRAGLFQLGVDMVIMVVALFVLPLDRVLLSMLGAGVLNLVLAINHRPGRYVGFS